MKALAEKLCESGYLPFYLFFGEMNLRYKDWSAAVSATPEPLRSLVNLFLLGEASPEADVSALLGDSVTERLVAAKILIRSDGSLRSNSFYLLVHRGLFYFAQISPDPFAYVGEDSLALTHYQTPVRNARVLDLCAGPGLQSLVSAQRGNSVTAVERSPEACAVLRINLELNGLTDRVEINVASVEDFATKNSERFEQILVNPPLVPMPTPATGFPVAGFGGSDGLSLTSVLLRDYRKFLEPKGHFELVGMTVAAKRGDHPVSRLARKLKLGGRLHILSRHRMAPGAVVMEMHAASLARARSTSSQTARETLKEHYRGSDHFFLFFARLQPSRTQAGLRLETLDMSTSHYGGWFS